MSARHASHEGASSRGKTAELQQLDDGLWITDAKQRFVGVEVGARMTVIRLAGGELMLHSPLAATPELVEKVKALGSVGCLVAPNCLHHLYIDQWQKVCPEATTYAAPALEAKRPDLQIDGVLGDQPESDWAGTLDQVLIAGLPMANEVVFFHAASATLIATDAAFNIGPSSPLLSRVFFRLGGAYGKLAPTLLERLMIRDRAAFKQSLEAVLDWPFDRVIVAHGDVVETGGRDAFARGYDWLLSR